MHNFEDGNAANEMFMKRALEARKAQVDAAEKERKKVHLVVNNITYRIELHF